MRKLTKQTIKPVLRHLDGYSGVYHFTLDTYKGVNSFQGGYASDVSDCYSYSGKPFDAYALDTKTGDVTDLTTKQIVMNVRG